MLKYIQVSHDFSDSQLYNKIVKLERKKLVVFLEKHNDVFWKTLRAFLGKGCILEFSHKNYSMTRKVCVS